MSASATITTPAPDRSEDIVHPEGVLLENYRRNPVVFYDHGFSGIMLPIGKSEDAEGNLTLVVTPDGIDATTYFSQSLCEACQVFALIEEGIVKSTSIGFMPLEAFPRTAKLDGIRPGLEITVWELLEYSWVGIPDNPEAVRKVLDRGRLAGSPICEPILKSLTSFAAPVIKTGRGWEPRSMNPLLYKNDPPRPDEDSEEEDVAPPHNEQDPATDEPAEEAAETSRAKPLGAQVLSAVFDSLSTLSGQIETALGPLENPQVKEHLLKLGEVLSGCLGETQSAFATAYPDEDDLQPAESGEEKSVAKFLQSSITHRRELASLIQQLKSLQGAPNLSSGQKSELALASSRLTRLSQNARRLSEGDSHAEELAEVKRSLRSLVKRFEDLMPASSPP